MSRIQQLLNLSEVAVTAPEWDALVDANFQSIQEFISTWEMTEDGNDVTIQLQDAAGENIEEECYLRIRICDGTGFAVSTSSQFTVTTGTVVETITADRDEIVKSDSTGTIIIKLLSSATTTTSAPTTTTATPEPISGIIRIGPPPVSVRLGDYSNTLTVS